jgi:hypothetical protein
MRAWALRRPGFSGLTPRGGWGFAADSGLTLHQPATRRTWGAQGLASVAGKARCATWT